MEPQRQQLVSEKKGSRPKAPKRIVITEGDIEILKFIHDYRLLRIRELELLTSRKYQRLHSRLNPLSENEYLGRLKRPQKPDIYYIKRSGLNVLLRGGLITDEQAERRVREGDLKDDGFLEHELLLGDLHLILTLATQNSPWELYAWKEGKEIHDSFQTVVNGQHQEVKIQPDAFFTLRETTAPAGEKKTRSFLIEADRSTMPKKERPGSRRFDDKIRKYEHYLRDRRPSKVLGVPHVNILTVTLTRLRRDGLASSAADILIGGSRRDFLFGSLQDFSFEQPAAIFNPVFMRPGDPEARRSLTPKVAEITASA